MTPKDPEALRAERKNLPAKTGQATAMRQFKRAAAKLLVESTLPATMEAVDILARRTRDRLRADANAIVSRQDLDALKLALTLGGAEQVGREVESETDFTKLSREELDRLIAAWRDEMKIVDGEMVADAPAVDDLLP
jgi:hypothetical protein